MAALTFHDSIQNVVFNFASVYEFPRVLYPEGLRTTTNDQKERPKTCLVHRKAGRFARNAVGSSNIRGECFGRGRTALEAELWVLELGFAREVDLSGFEAAFQIATLSAPVDPAAPTGNKVFIDLAEGEQSDPTEQNGSSGSRALYTLRVFWPGN